MDDAKPETPQVRAGSVIAAVGGIVAILLFVAIGFAMFFPGRIGKTYAVQTPFPAPQVIPDERRQRLALQAQQRRVLEGKTGRMPIEHAMQVIAAKRQRGYDPIESP